MKKVFLVIVTLSFFFLLYDTLFFRQLLWGTPGTTVATGLIETFAGNLALPCGFLLLTFIYHSNRRNIFSVCSLIWYLFTGIYQSTQNSDVYDIYNPLFFLHFLFYCKKRKDLKCISFILPVNSPFYFWYRGIF